MQVGLCHLLLLEGLLHKGQLEFLQENGQKSPSQMISVEFCGFERVNFLFFLSIAEKSAFTALKMVRTITAFDTSSLIVGLRISPQTCI